MFKKYFKILIYLSLLILVNYDTVLSASELPKCKGKNYNKYKNCFGSYLNKDISKSGDKDKTTRDYTGEFGSSPGIREGHGSSKVYVNGKLLLTYVGEFINDKAEGIAVRTGYNSDGTKVEYVGEFKEGLMDGQGTVTFSDGTKATGTWKGFKTQGIAVVTYAVREEQNRREYIGELDNYVANGNGTLIFVDGDQYIGEFKNNLFHGVGTYTWKNGSKYIGEWIEDNRTGQGTQLNQYGKEIYSGYWTFNKWNGIGKMTNEDGSTYVGNFLNDKFEGQGTYTWKDGSKYIGKWKNGQRDGKRTYINSSGVKKDQEWENGKQVELNIKKSGKKDINKKSEKNNVNLEKERKKLEIELKKLQEEKNKAKQAADKQKNIDAEIRKYFAEASNFERPENFKFAQLFIIHLQDFIKRNPEEFDILEITELMIDNKNVLEGLWNDKDKESFNSLYEYTQQNSTKFSSYIESKFDERIEKKIKEYNFEVKNVEDNIVFLKKYLQDNLTSKDAKKIVLQIREAEKIFNDPTLEKLKKINNKTNNLIKSLNNSKNKKLKKKVSKNQSISQKKYSIKGSPKEKIITILKELDVSYREIEFSRDEKDFIIYNLEIYDQKIEKIEVDGLNEIYLEGFFKSLIKSEETDLFNSYNGKYFDEIIISGISNLKFSNIKISGKEIVMSNLDFKKFDIIKKLINPSNGIQEYDKKIISYMMSASFDLYFDDIITENLKTGDTYEYDYAEISGFKDLSINKFLIKNAIFKYGSETQNIKEFLLEKLILDKSEILAFLNSDKYDSRFTPQEYFSYIQNGMKSLRKIEINEFSLITKNERILDFDNFQFNNIKFDYLGDNGDKKIPISFEFIVDGADFNLKNAHEFRDISDSLKYEAIKFDFGGRWDWNTRKNNLSISLDLGIKDAASIELKSSFTDLSSEVLNLTGAPLGAYLMTEPKLKKLNLAFDDNSLKNRLIDYFAKQENMTSEQYKDFIAQSLKIFIKTIGANNTLVKNMEEALTNFIYDESNITLSAKPLQPLSVTDLIPDFKDPDTNKIIDKLNLKITNSLF